MLRREAGRGAEIEINSTLIYNAEAELAASPRGLWGRRGGGFAVTDRCHGGG